MSPKVTLVLAFATLVSVVAAVIVVLAEPGTSRIAYEGEPAFPVLREDPDAVARILIETADDVTLLERQDDGGWSAASSNGYPASSGRVRDLVIKITGMQLIEPKTSRPERFARLEVENPGTDGAVSKLVRLIDADGHALTEVIIGKTRSRLTGTEPGGTYIRRLGEDQSWLASGQLELPEEPALWLDRRIVDLQADDVVRVEVQPPDGPAHALFREDDEWRLEGEDGALSPEAETSELAGALQALDLRDVRPQGEMTWPEAVWHHRFITGSGLEVALRLAEVDEGLWATIEASAGGSDAEPSVTERAAAISSRTEGWAYRLPDALGEALRRPRSDWLAAAS